MTDDHYMRLAIQEARKAFEAGEVPVGAIVIQQGRSLGKGHNQVELLNDPTAHAEILALTSSFHFLGSKYLPEATLYVTVEPCLMCAGAIYWSKIGRIVYGADDVKNGYRKFCSHPLRDEAALTAHPFHPKTQLTKGILASECAELMKEFFRSRR